MGGKNNVWGDFIIPSDIFDDQEWMADALIDSENANPCLLVYPPIASECPNCVFDLSNNRSSNIYKAGGPVPFVNSTICPYCDGEGKRLVPNTDTLKVRTYLNARDFVNLPPGFVAEAGMAQIIGYMTDATKILKTTEIVLYSNVQGIIRVRYKRSGTPLPWGFRSRYFSQLLTKVESGV